MAETPADFALLEVGLGGRLDATNVIARPRLTVITPVSIDHQQYLGETLRRDRRREGGHPEARRARHRRPQQPEALDVIEARAERGRRAADRSRTSDWQVWEEHGRMAFLDDGRAPRPAAAAPDRRAPGGERRASRSRRCGRSASTRRPAPRRSPRAEWPARLQRLRRGPLVAAARACRALARRRPQPGGGRGAGRGAGPAAAAAGPPGHAAC